MEELVEEELVEEELVEEELSRDASRRASGSMGVVLGESGMKLGLLIPFNSARVPVSGVYRIVFSIPIRESTYVFTIFCHHSL